MKTNKARKILHGSPLFRYVELLSQQGFEIIRAHYNTAIESSMLEAFCFGIGTVYLSCCADSDEITCNIHMHNGSIHEPYGIDKLSCILQEYTSNSCYLNIRYLH